MINTFFQPSSVMFKSLRFYEPNCISDNFQKIGFSTLMKDDEECSGDLTCGTNNCKQFSDVFHPKDDCCVKPTPSFIIPNPVSSSASGIKSPRCQVKH